MADWSAKQYLKFEDQRTRPALDLLAQVPLTDASRIFDLGCGPGNSTQLLCERFPQADVIGVDSSPNMLRQARERLPQCEFVEADLSQWSAPADADLLYSNATFQWVPDHLAVMLRLLQGLKAGGVLAVQMPDNLDEPSHVWMREVAHEKPFADLLPKNPRDRAVLPSVGDYYDALKPHCAGRDLAHLLPAPARWSGNDRRMGEGHGPASVPRSAAACGRRSVLARLYRAHRGCLSVAEGRQGAAAFPAIVHRCVPLNRR